MTKENTTTRAGFAALIGAPNAGKSTLLNQLVGQKLSIVSAKAQTTRMRVLGLLMEGESQIGLIDTPGIFQAKKPSRLDKAMLQAAWHSLDEADAIVLLVDAASRQPDAKVDAIIETLVQQKRRCILVFNKVDKVKVEKLLPMTERLNQSGIFDEIFMISALNGDGVPALRKKLASMMKLGPYLFPTDQLSDMSERLLAAEATREALFSQLHDELPYAVTVRPEAWEERKDGSILIRQTILVTKTNYRAMVLGKNGARIKEIGSAARTIITDILGVPVHLFLDVKVDERWAETNEFYRLFGLEG